MYIQTLLFHHIDSSRIRVRCLLANVTAAQHCCTTAFAVYNPMRHIEYLLFFSQSEPKNLYGNGASSKPE